MLASKSRKRSVSKIAKRPRAALNLLQGIDVELSSRANAYSIRDILRSLIMSGTIPPGTIVSQAGLAREIGVSRTPVREAMRMLQDEKWIDAQPNNRGRVKGFDADELDAVYAMRIFTEPLAVALTIRRLSRAHLEMIEKAHERMVACERKGTFEQWVLDHRAFHLSLTSFGGETLRHFIGRLLEQSTRFQYLFANSQKRTWRAVRGRDHAQLLEACRRREPKVAYSLMLQHLSETALTLLDDFPGPEGRPHGAAIHAAIKIMASGKNTIDEANHLGALLARADKPHLFQKH
jgi:DNA-binding GntR family transcriptional regulator